MAIYYVSQPPHAPLCYVSLPCSYSVVRLRASDSGLHAQWHALLFVARVSHRAVRMRLSMDNIIRREHKQKTLQALLEESEARSAKLQETNYSCTSSRMSWLRSLSMSRRGRRSRWFGRRRIGSERSAGRISGQQKRQSGSDAVDKYTSTTKAQPCSSCTRAGRTTSMY